MLVKTERLIPGCIVFKDVMGKTKAPLVPKDTVLTAEHITFLQKFLIESVHVSAKLSNGDPFKPNQDRQQDQKETLDVQSLSLDDHYRYTVEQYRQMFTDWKNQIPIDIVAVRQFIIPLLERTHQQDSFIFHNLTKIDPNHLYSQAVSLSILSAYTGAKMGYEKGKWIQAGIAGLLADSGLSQMTTEFNGSMSTSKEQLKKHPALSYKMVEKLSMMPRQAKIAVLQHHEYLDGSGYPFGLKENKIDPLSKILSFCDDYYVHAIKQDNPPVIVLDEMKNKYASRFEQQIVQLFSNQLIQFL